MAAVFIAGRDVAGGVAEDRARDREVHDSVGVYVSEVKHRAPVVFAVDAEDRGHSHPLRRRGEVDHRRESGLAEDHPRAAAMELSGRADLVGSDNDVGKTVAVDVAQVYPDPGPRALLRAVYSDDSRDGRSAAEIAPQIEILRAEGDVYRARLRARVARAVISERAHGYVFEPVAVYVPGRDGGAEQVARVCAVEPVDSGGLLACFYHARIFAIAQVDIDPAIVPAIARARIKRAEHHVRAIVSVYVARAHRQALLSAEPEASVKDEQAVLIGRERVNRELYSRVALGREGGF